MKKKESFQQLACSLADIEKEYVEPYFKRFIQWETRQNPDYVANLNLQSSKEFLLRIFVICVTDLVGGRVDIDLAGRGAKSFWEFLERFKVEDGSIHRIECFKEQLACFLRDSCHLSNKLLSDFLILFEGVGKTTAEGLLCKSPKEILDSLKAKSNKGTKKLQASQLEEFLTSQQKVDISTLKRPDLIRIIIGFLAQREGGCASNEIHSLAQMLQTFEGMGQKTANLLLRFLICYTNFFERCDTFVKHIPVPLDRVNQRMCYRVLDNYLRDEYSILFPRRKKSKGRKKSKEEELEEGGFSANQVAAFQTLSRKVMDTIYAPSIIFDNLWFIGHFWCDSKNWNCRCELREDVADYIERIYTGAYYGNGMSVSLPHRCPLSCKSLPCVERRKEEAKKKEKEAKKKAEKESGKNSS